MIGGYIMFRNLLVAFFSVFILMSVLPPSSLAAMDPAEVNRINEDSPYQIVGMVTADEFIKDITENPDHPVQLRKLTVHISKLVKAPENHREDEYTEVFYHYIPKWVMDQYVGGKRMDIAVHDVVKLWLVDGEYGWEPVLGGESISYIEYYQDRAEHIPEPFFHSIMRVLNNFINMNTEILVLIALFLVLGWAFFQGLRTKKI